MNPKTEPTTLSNGQDLAPRAVLTNAYERQICTKKTVVRLKVEPIKIPPPKRIIVEIVFNDGTTRTAEAVLVSAYIDYAYYDLAAADAKEVYPHVDKIQRIEIVDK